MVDASDDNRQEKIEAVDRVLEEVGAAEVPQLLVYNKIDLLGLAPRTDVDADDRPHRIWLSAREQRGFEELLDALRGRYCEPSSQYRLRLSAAEGQIRAFLFETGAIEAEEFENNGDMSLKLRLTPALLAHLQRKFEISAERLEMQADSLAGAA